MITRAEARQTNYPLAIMWIEWKGGMCEYYSGKPRQVRGIIALNGRKFDRNKTFKTADEFMNWINNFNRDENLRELFIKEFRKFVVNNPKQISLTNKLLSILW